MVLTVLCIYLVIVNLVAFALYGVDKSRARRSAWRIPEATLLLVALIGGSLGAFAGMRVWHHKTQKLRFKVLVPLFLIAHIALIAYLFGAGILRI